MRKINENFQCISCKKQISAAEKTCRNHCPYCFTSLHVDGDVPGDRASKCGGVMVPIEYKVSNGQDKILFLCTVCKKQHWNKVLPDDHIVEIFDKLRDNKERYI